MSLQVLLRMYNLDEVMPHVRVWERAIARSYRGRGHLTLRQTCGWPLISYERADWRVVAIPQYAIEGCNDCFYSSVVITPVRKEIQL